MRNDTPRSFDGSGRGARSAIGTPTSKRVPQLWSRVETHAVGVSSVCLPSTSPQPLATPTWW